MLYVSCVFSVVILFLPSSPGSTGGGNRDACGGSGSSPSTETKSGDHTTDKRNKRKEIAIGEGCRYRTTVRHWVVMVLDLAKNLRGTSPE